MSVLTFPWTGADSASHGRSGLDGMSVRTFPGTGGDSADDGRSGLDGMSVLTFPGTGADSADHGRCGVDGISLPTFPVTGAESLVHAYCGDDGISLPKYVFADASYHLFGVYSNLISSSFPYFFPNFPLHQGVVYIIRRILVRYGQIWEPANIVDSCYVQSRRAFVVTDTGQIRDSSRRDTNKQTPN